MLATPKHSSPSTPSPSFLPLPWPPLLLHIHLLLSSQNLNLPPSNTSPFFNLLDPLNLHLRNLILRCGYLIQATYDASTTTKTPSTAATAATASPSSSTKSCSTPNTTPSLPSSTPLHVSASQRPSSSTPSHVRSATAVQPSGTAPISVVKPSSVVLRRVFA